MIQESLPWKNDLKKWAFKLEARMDNYNERTYVTIEKAIFNSAFIMRKLLDCKTKITTKVSEKVKIRVVRYVVSPKDINLVRRYIQEETMKEVKPNTEEKSLRFICNLLIHSTFFDICHDSHQLIGFFVSSDNKKDKNNNRKSIYYIMIGDWISAIKMVANDQITYLSMTLDKENGNYIVKAR